MLIKTSLILAILFLVSCGKEKPSSPQAQSGATNEEVKVSRAYPKCYPGTTCSIPCQKEANEFKLEGCTANQSSCNSIYNQKKKAVYDACLKEECQTLCTDQKFEYVFSCVNACLDPNSSNQFE